MYTDNSADAVDRRLIKYYFIGIWPKGLLQQQFFKPMCFCKSFNLLFFSVTSYLLVGQFGSFGHSDDESVAVNLGILTNTNASQQLEEPSCFSEYV